MTTLFLLLSIISLDVGRSRTTTTPRSIERTCIRVAAGFAASMGREERLTLAARWLEGEPLDAHIHTPRLYVDGVRDGSPAGRIVRSVWRLVAFSLDRSTPGQSVELRYTLVYRGLVISRRVTITDGRIVSRASFGCQMGPQGRVKAVWLQYTARESPQGATITTAATVRVNTGICPHRSTSRLRVVNRLAGRQISEQLDSALWSAECEGRRLSTAGHDAIIGHVSHLTSHLLRWTR